MQRTITIPGVGDVEVGPEFESMSPDQQEATVNEIIAASRRSAANPKPTANQGPIGSPEEVFTPPPTQGAPAQPAFDPEEQRKLNDTLQQEVRAYFDISNSEGTLTPEGLQQFYKDISGGRLQVADPEKAIENYRKYGWNGVVYGGGNKPAPDGSEPAPQAQPKQEEPKGPVQNVAVRQLGALNEGIADTLGFPVDLVNAGLGALDYGADKLLGDDGIRLSSDKPFLGSDSIRSGMRSLGMGQVDESYAPQNGFEDYSQAFFRGVGQTAVPVLGTISKGGQIYNQMFRTASNPSLVRKALADDAVNAFKRPKGTIAAELGASTGANLGGELADDVAPDNPYVKTALTLAGGATGATSANALSKRATPNRRAELWVEKVLEKDGNNAALPHLPEVAEDLFTVTKGTVGFEKATPKGRAQVTVKQINDLEDRYLSDIAGRLDKLPNLEPAQRQYLKEAIRGKHSLDGLNVDLLRGTPEGDFVADAIIRTQTLRAATPEVPRKSALPFAREAGALMSGGGVFAMDGGIASLPAYGLARYMLSRVGNTEAARVHSAENMVSNIERYRKLAEQVGPSTYQGNRDLFMRMTDEAMNEEWLAKQAKEAEEAAEKAAKEEAQQGLYGRKVPNSERVKPESPAEKKRWKSEMDARMYPAEEMYQRAENSDLSKELSGMADEELAAMRGIYDDVKGANAELKQLYKDIKTKSGQKTEGQKALDKLEGERKKAGKNALDLIAKYRKTAMSPDEFMAKLDQPPEGAKVKEPKPYTRSPSATIKFNNIDKGLTGSSRVQATYADMVGVPEADMLRALDVVAKDPDIAGNPKLLDDITLIKNKYTTETKKGLSELLVPRMKAVLEQDGTMAKIKAQAEQAQAKTSARLKLANPNAETTTAVPQSTPTRAAEGDMVGISRPEQWEAGARNFQAQANASISKLDSMASEKAMTAYGNAPEVIRDSFRTTEEAVEYIKEVVMPELEIAGVDPTEIANIRSYLYEVAAAKRYPTREAYEAGTKKK